MNRQLFEKTYPGEYPRPTAEASYMESENLLTIATPWGNKDAVKEMNSTIRECFSNSFRDQEATSPFPQLPGLSTLENNLRAATLLANDVIYKKLNKNAYTSSCEALVIGFHQSQMTWIQLGQPHLLLVRDGTLIPLQVALDLSIDYLCDTPLPCKLLGIERQLDLDVKSITLQPSDFFVMLCRSTLPAQVFSQNFQNKTPEATLDMLFDVTVTAGAKIPFWMGVFG